MSSDRSGSVPIISLRQVSKKYPIYDRPVHKFMELLTLRRRQFHREFWALRDVDLEVVPGRAVGILGPNGSGKSTLLQIVAGILQQTRGDCYVGGNVAALLELGTGFNPEFSGRENVFMNGVINGLSQREVHQRFDSIVDFAEIGEFIDQPVKTYSSGMYVRLAFAVAIHVDPEILLVDEALAVGDLIFQHRCINRIRALMAEGKTILFVTHDLQAVTRFCDEAILLDQGRKIASGSPEEVTRRYQALILDRERGRPGTGEIFPTQQEDGSLPLVNTIPHIHSRYGKGAGELLGVVLLRENGEVATEVRSGELLRLLVTASFKKEIRSPIVGFTVRDKLGVEVTASNSSYEGVSLPAASPGDTYTVAFAFRVPELRPGSYSISPALAQGNIWEHAVEDWIDNAYIFTLEETGLIYGTMKWSVDVKYRKIDRVADQGEAEST